MSGDRRVAPGGKATPQDVAYVRRYGARAAARKGVPLSGRQLARIEAGQSWRDGWLPARCGDDEVRHCVICERAFERRFSNGRPRSDAVWQKKLTCGPGCGLRLAWRTGAFTRRRSGPEPSRTHH